MAWRLLLPIAVAVAFGVFYRHPYVRSAVWVCLLLVSYDGWGRGALEAARRAGLPDLDVDLGVRLSWGMAVTLFLGGIACMLHFANRSFLFAEVAVGWALEATVLLHARGRAPSLRAVRASLARPLPLFIGVVAVLFFANELVGGVANPWTNRSDDEPLYFFIPQKLLDTGSMLEPYNVRRMTSYGGQFFLHGQFLLFGSHYQLNAVDQGLGTFLVLAHVFGETARPSLRRPRVLALVLGFLLVVTIDTVRYNVGSLMTVLAALLGTHRTWMIARRDDDIRPAGYVLTALCCASACVLRTSAAPPVAAFLGLTAIQHALPRPLRLQREALKHVAVRVARTVGALGAATAASLLAWLALYRQSSGTWIYPLSRGNMTPGFAILKVESGVWFNLKHVLSDLAYPKPIATSILLLAAGALPLTLGRAAPRERATAGSDAPILVTVAFFAMIFTSVLGGAFDEAPNARYYFGFLMWAVLMVVLGAVRPGALGARGIVAIVAVLIHVAATREPLKKRFDAHLTLAENNIDPPFTAIQDSEAATRLYREAQAEIPKGARAVMTVEEPFRFDMKRNPLFSLDLAGGLGPAPGFPCFQGPEALAAYLLANGIDYIITIPYVPTRYLDLYDLEAWRKHRTATRSFLVYEAPYMVDAMESIEALRKTRRTVVKGGGLAIIDLRTR